MTFDDRRELLQNLFSGKTDDESGTAYTLYVTRDGKKKRIIYTIRGNFGEFIGYLYIKLNMLDRTDP
jgi:hypothetical protein